MNEFKGFPNVNARVKQIVDAAWHLEGEGLTDMQDEDLEQLAHSPKKELDEGTLS